MIDFDLANESVFSHQKIFQGEFGRLRDVVTGPDEFLYLLTSNRDGRGDPKTNDDKILRIVPLINGEIDPPIKQLKSGIDPKNILCKSGLLLMFKINGNPVCIKDQHVPKLVERGLSR
jgi:hypothetical protein